MGASALAFYYEFQTLSFIGGFRSVIDLASDRVDREHGVEVVDNCGVGFLKVERLRLASG